MAYRYDIRSGVTRIKTKVDLTKTLMALVILVLPAVLYFGLTSASAATTQVIVTPANASVQGWSTADTRPGGAVNYLADSSAPGNPKTGALQLTTTSSTAAKAQYMHEANTPLSGVSDLSYSTKQNAANFPGGDASFQLPVCLGGFNSPVTATNPSGCTGFTTFVYEPYENGVVTPSVWQSWDVDAGQMWSSRSYTGSGSCAVVAGGGGAPFYSLSSLQAACPSAVAVGFGVNIGSNNPSYDVEADLVQFNDSIYNFELFESPSDKDACKRDGWKTLTDQNGQAFKNQGQCVSWTNGRGQ